jgi:N-acetylglucosamine kinase
MCQSPFVLGLSGGGTHTRCALIDGAGQVLGRGEGGPANHHFVPAEVVARSVSDALAGALEGLPAGGAVQAVGSAIAGSAMPAGRSPVAETLERLLPHTRAWHWDEADVAAVDLVDPARPGVVLLAGTGSRAVAYGQRGRAAAGGWGLPLGDEGGAGSLGWWALQAATRALEGYGPPTALLPLVLEQLDAGDRPALIARIYGQGLARHKLGLLAPGVVACAEAGHTVAVGLLERAGRELALLAASVAHRSGHKVGSLTVVTAGGTFAAGRALLDPLAAALEQELPGALLREPLYPSEVGAALLTLRALLRISP